MEFEGHSANTIVETRAFPCVAIAAKFSRKGSRLYCIGQPGSEDLETTRKNVKTGYNSFHVSSGRFRGHTSDDLQDNSEIGALSHDCWTYWGHSGAPLVGRESGHLVGLHSSWDCQTGMRHGIALEAIQGFLRQFDNSSH